MQLPESSHKNNTNSLIRQFSSLSAPLSLISAAFSFIVLCGYYTHIEFLYRPIKHGEATHPLTAMTIFFIALSVCFSKKAKYRIYAYITTFIGILLATSCLIDFIYGTKISNLATPFYAQVIADTQLGKSNSMGINSAAMLLVIGFSIAFKNIKWRQLSQATAFTALAIPMFSLTGYAYNIDSFYGKMSLLTTTFGFALSISTLALTANIGGLKAILSPNLSGKIARLQTLVGYLVPFILGFLVIKSFNTSSEQNLFGLYVVAVCWLIILMLSVAAAMYENIDQKHRKLEALLKNAAMTDQLTNLPNRRKFMEVGEHEIDRMKRTHSPLWLLMIDIDYFKKINDTAGHLMGDQVLTEIGAVLKEATRAADIVGRLGGEEFAILLTDTTKEGVQHVSESLLYKIETMTIEGWTDIHGRITASIGIAQADESSNLSQLIDCADKALYQSKSNGRNRVTFATIENEE